MTSTLFLKKNKIEKKSRIGQMFDRLHLDCERLGYVSINYFYLLEKSKRKIHLGPKTQIEGNTETIK